MNSHDESQLAERRNGFLRHLPRRVDVIGRRLHRFLQSGWDINGLALIHEDARELATATAEHGLEEAGEHLRAMAELLQDVLAQEALPDPALGERLWNLIEEIGAATPRPSEPVREPGLQPVGNAMRAETPPLTYWRRWASDAPPASYVEAAPAAPAPAPVVEEVDPWGNEAPRYGLAPTRVPDHVPSPAPAPAPVVVTSTPAMPAAVVMPPPAPAVPAAASAPSPAPMPVAATVATPAGPGETPVLGVDADFRIYHLTGHGPLSLELDQRLEAQKVEVELLEDVEELKELLGALPADLVLVDAEFSGHLEGIGEMVRQGRLRATRPLLLVAIANADDINLRLSARRAGVDSLVVGPAHANDVLRRLQALVEPGREAPFRILIVEDDRSQALFAEGILRNAGMDSLVVIDALGVLPALEQFQPDLILMDLNMPDANGIELTALIREQEAFMHTPIVFLSGESDEDRQFDAIDAGGDDFLAKPIRPRHLISAVQNRVRRHRSLEERRSRRPAGKDAVTGLLDRNTVLEQIGERLATLTGGILFLEIESVGLLRDRLGLSALEQLLGEAGRLINTNADGLPAARFGDGSYLVFGPGLDEPGLEALANQLRKSLMERSFQAQGHPLRLRASIGICALKHGFTETGALLNAVEKATREARTHERGVRRYEPPRASDAQREAVLLAHIREAVKHHHLELLYQPVVAVAGSDDSQYQVLLRLRDAGGAVHSAAEIIPMAERGDFIVDIDRWVVMQALALIRDRLAEGRALRLFVTQSPLTLADHSQADWLKEELARHEVPGTSLVIELRLEDAAVHGATIQQFCEAMVPDGVQFCLSQFEPGTDADRLLERLPLGFVKLARKYTGGAISPSTRDELKTLIERAHRRGLEVIGHGVEDPQAAATLWMSGIDFIQGNLVQQANQALDFDFNQAVL